MRIGLVCPYTWEVPGGVQAHVHDLSVALLELGHDVSVITPADDDTELPPHVVPGGHAVRVPYNGSVARLAFGFRSVARLRRWLREGQFDVLHVHEPVAPSLSLLACWAADGPIVATSHTSNPKSMLLTAAYPLVQTAMERISARIAVSEAARKTFVEHLGGSAVLIPNGVLTRRYQARDRLDGWPGDGGSLGFLGRMDEPRKGLGILVEAFATLAEERRELRLLVAGPGESEDVFDALPERLHRRVAVLGKVDEADKVRMLHSVDVFVAPNTGGESFGIVLAEAMAAGATILASDLDAFQQVLGPGKAGALFPVGDAAALAAEAAALLDDPDRRRQLGAAALEAVQAYDWATVAEDVVRVYETVTQGARVVEAREDRHHP